MLLPANFGYNANQKRIIVEASSLARGEQTQLFEPIYENGGTDEGLCVRLPQSNEVACFQVSRIVASNRVIRSWTLIPTRETVERIPSLQDHTVLLFNS